MVESKSHNQKAVLKFSSGLQLLAGVCIINLSLAAAEGHLSGISICFALRIVCSSRASQARCDYLAALKILADRALEFKEFYGS